MTGSQLSHCSLSFIRRKNFAMPQPSILISSPDEHFGALLKSQLEASHNVLVSTHLSSVLQLLMEEQIDFMVIDQRWELSDGAVADRVLSCLQRRSPSSRALILTGRDVPELLKLYADAANVDFLIAPPSVPETIEIVKRMLATKLDPSTVNPVQTRNTTKDVTCENQSAAQNSPEPDALQYTPDQETKSSQGFGPSVFPGVTRNYETRSPQMKQMLEDLMVAAAHNVTILLIGETGAGKTFLSSLIHEASPRRNEPFIHVACGALPRDLIESELFGHVKGSFTSAHADKEGKFIAARKGTILLDEIDVLAPEQQVKLLRVIETGQFEPVGSNQTLTSQARLVVASNLDLEPLVEQGKFRPDLYYRLNMMKFDLLPLRKRKVDVIPMCKKFILKFQEQHNIRIHRIDDSLLDAVLNYPWPGNVRELEHVMQRAVIYCKDGVLTQAHLPANIINGNVGPTNDPSVRLGRIDPNDSEHSLEQQVATSERDIIEQALFKNNFSRTNTAKELGISRVTLYNKMKKYDMMK